MLRYRDHDQGGRPRRLSVPSRPIMAVFGPLGRAPVGSSRALSTEYSGGPASPKLMTHVSLDEILEWERQEGEFTFDVLSKEHFDVELKRYPTEQREQYVEHTHEMDELYYIISGAADVTIGEDTYAIEAGEMVFVEAGEEHEFHDREEELIVLKILAGE